MVESKINIIAEIGTSHEGSFEKAKELVDAAADSGADTIKFQWVYADEILHPKTGYVKLPTGNIPLYERFKQLECPVSFYKDIMDYVHSKGCKFCCSPFGLRSLRELLELNPDFVKIASPELNHYKMLEALRDWRQNQKLRGEAMVPVILSSGVSTLADIDKAVRIVGREGVSLLHCITSYPAPEDQYNIRLISTLHSVLGIETGLSDHSLDPVLVPVLSTACGGTIIEKHFTLSRQTSGLDDPVALEPEQFALMVHTVHQTEATFRHYGEALGMERTIEQLAEQFGRQRVMTVLGDGVKRLASAEEANYGRTNRSLHFMRAMKKGETISQSDIAILRTEKILTPGISPEYYDLLIGKKISRDVEDGAGVQFEDFIL
ncbi:N-acetylneuraminate synthase family protein [Treponema bryantii]|uniref:N-acetylneuraminate synthase family protein n=1 Tax=Treponema bryantii TaxID=163 RepID=UPI0003B2FFAC|nr:N-acetylneuraminate synthase family protein [Treponema bryantii]